MTGLGPQIERQRRRILAEQNACHECGKPATADNPMTTDYVVVHGDDGRVASSSIRAAHVSCTEPA